MQEPESFDSQLDQALHSYASTEPRAGLDQRVLTRLTAQETTQQRPIFKLFWLTAAASLVAVFAIVAISTHQRPRQQEIAHQTQAPIPSLPEAYPVVLAQQPVHRAHPRHASHTTPALEHGQPQLTESDRLMLQFASLNPQEALNFSQLQKSSAIPITISPLQVQSLASNPIVIPPIAMNRDEHQNF